jgi:Replication-relaxation
MLGVEDREETRWLPHVRADRQLSLERSPRLTHMTGRNWFFVVLARDAREYGGELRKWLNEADTAAHYENAAIRQDDRARLPHPDGAGTWAEDGRAASFLLEYDTGTEHLPVLAGKLDGYQVLAAGRAWRGQICPVLLFCFGSPRREQGARRALAATRQAADLRIATASIDRASPARPGRYGCRC